jgi:fatty acid desaturase
MTEKNIRLKIVSVLYKPVVWVCGVFVVDIWATDKVATAGDVADAGGNVVCFVVVVGVAVVVFIVVVVGEVVDVVVDGLWLLAIWFKYMLWNVRFQFYNLHAKTRNQSYCPNHKTRRTTVKFLLNIFFLNTFISKSLK